MIRSKTANTESASGQPNSVTLSSEASSRACSWLKANKPRNDETIVGFSLLACSVTNLEVVTHRAPCPVQILALSTRSAFELQLIARSVLSNETHLHRWLSETASDNLQVLRAFAVLLKDESSQELVTANRQIDTFHDDMVRRGLNVKAKPLSVKQMARDQGLTSEYDAMFALTSKLVHPSAFLVNQWQYNKDQTMATTLVLKLLEYSDDLRHFVASRFGIPDHIVTVR